MIACPVCGGPTGVMETRSLDHHVRRRRHCLAVTCAARITTIELAVPDHAHLVDPVAVPRAYIQQLADGVRAIIDGTSTLPPKPR